MTRTGLYIASSYFTCGVFFGPDNRVSDSAPIVKYMKGWTREAVITYCHKKRWTVSPVVDDLAG